MRGLVEQHGQRMHLIVVRRDLIYYQHLHPSLSKSGSWTAAFTLPEAGVYRVFAAGLDCSLYRRGPTVNLELG